MMISLRGAFLFLVIQKVTGQACGPKGDCDTHVRCPVWKEEGECYRSSAHMATVCPVSCSDKKSYPRSYEDVHENCSVWVNDAECDTNDSVKMYCKASCRKYRDDIATKQKKASAAKKKAEARNEDPSCTNNHKNCEGWAELGECDNNPNYMKNNCQKACGVCKKKVEEEKVDPAVEDLLAQTTKFGKLQTATGNAKAQTIQTIREMMNYFESKEYKSLSPSIIKYCKNSNDLCSFWAAIGECENNMSFMKVQCAPACKSCHLIDMSNRCPPLPDAIPGKKPGELNEMFERLVQTAPGNRTLTKEERENLAKLGTPEYSVTVHSRPSSTSETVNVKTDKESPPWVVTFDNFLTDEECDALIKHGFDAGFKRSEDVGKPKFDGTVDSKQSTGRTSENAWCSKRNDCRDLPVPKRVMDRISTAVEISPENSEDFQILKYEVGQFYETHHDYIHHQETRQCGPRILTFFLYLSDVEEGGGTDFPRLGITVTPKKGRAILWPSVYNADPVKKDSRTEHQALPVLAGTKFGANAWIHLFDYQKPQDIGCS